LTNLIIGLTIYQRYQHSNWWS